MAQDVNTQRHHHQFDNTLASILDAKTLDFLDKLIEESRREMFEAKPDSATQEQ